MLADSVNAIVQDPDPLLVVTVSQPALAWVLQAHPACVVRAKVDIDARPGSEKAAGDTEYVQPGAEAAWVTVTVCPAIVTVPERDAVPVLAAMVSVTLPLPEPLAGPTAIQPAPDVAVHAQPVPAVTATLAVPAAEPCDTVVGATV